MTGPDAAENRKQSRRVASGSRVHKHKVTFFAPALKHYETSELSQSCHCSFAPVSVTGPECDLMCDHCQARILSSMVATTDADALFTHAAGWRREGGAGLLVSGGSDSGGRVPLEPFVPTLGKIRDELGLSVAVHTGITDSRLAESLSAAHIDVAMIDIIGDESTIREVCHLRQVTVKDYAVSLEALCSAGVAVVPHVVIGLDRGRIRGEMEALKLISSFPVSAVVLVGLRPLAGTPMAAVEPPAPVEMSVIFQAARSLFPRTPVLLGCERPAGRHREETDRLALEAGLDGIAFPADGTVAHARTLGLEPGYSEMCCAMTDIAVSGDVCRAPANCRNDGSGSLS